jgi:hypothetical protein
MVPIKSDPKTKFFVLERHELKAERGQVIGGLIESFGRDREYDVVQ